MARQNRTIQSVDSYPTLQPAADSLDKVFLACDAANFEQTPMTGPFILIAWNSGATPRTLTINSVADAQRRTGDITNYSVGAGDIAMVAFPSTVGWKQADGNLYYQGAHAELKIACISMSI